MSNLSMNNPPILQWVD